MKRRLKKIVCTFLILITLFNFTFVNVSRAEGKNAYSLTTGDILKLEVDGVAGILLMPAKICLVIVGNIARMASSETAEIGASSSQSVMFLSLNDIFFHNVTGAKKLPILDVNFFDANKNTVVGRIRTNIAGWYYSLRNLAICISLLVLIYIGIRMAISTLAEDKVKYKKMLTDWIVGFITIFLLHYIIVATIYINEALVTTLSKSATIGQWGSIISNYEDIILCDALGTVYFTTGMANAIIYLGMSVMGFMFVYTYLKRMITVAFLIVIAPIITVTYSIDKVGDRKITSIKHMVKRVYI